MHFPCSIISRNVRPVLRGVLRYQSVMSRLKTKALQTTSTMSSATISSTSTFYIPSVDISPYLKDPNCAASQDIIVDIRAACLSTGFIQLTGHGISPSLQASVFQAAARFFALPFEAKLALDAKKNVGRRGYDVLASQSYEPDVLPDLKEGYYVGIDFSPNDPRVINQRFFTGPNVWPSEQLLAPEEFRKPVETYYSAMMRLSEVVLDLIAATLPYGPEVFDTFKANEPACPLRLLHYPPMPTDANGTKRQLGSSAHTDFGAITLLLQDEHPGLEVLDQQTGKWVGIPPNEAAYVVNIGDMLSKWTGGLYKSSVHRVLNKNKTDRYSVVFFFDGNLDWELRPLDGSEPEDQRDAVLTVEGHMLERIRTTYGNATKNGSK